MTPPPLTLETATALLSLANADVWHLDHVSQQLLGAPDTLALWLDGPPPSSPLTLADLRPWVHPEDWAALTALWGNAATDSPQTTVVRLLNRHGAWRWLRLRTQVVARSAAQQPVRSIGLVSDISAEVRHRTHLQLQQTFAAVMATSPDRNTLAHAIVSAALALPDLDGGGLYLRDADGGYTLLVTEGLSPSFVAAVGQLAPGSPPAVLADAGHLVCSFADGLAPQHSAEWGSEPALLARAGLPTEGIQALVVVPIRVGGVVCACLNLASTHARRLPDATVTLLHTLSVQFGQALAHLNAREEAQHQRENMEGFFQTLQDYVTVLNEQARIQYISHSVRQQLGYGDALLGQSVLVMHPPRVHAQAMDAVQAMLAGKLSSCPLPLLAADGREVMADTRIVRGHWNGQPALLAVSRDVTERQAIEQRLAHDHSLLKALINALPDLFFFKNPSGVYLACNSRFESLYGCTEAEIVGKTDFDFVSHELAEIFQAKDLAAVQQGGSATNEERLHFASDGHEEFVETIKTPVHTPDGTLLGVLGIARDITQRKAAEAERNELLARLQNLAEQLPGVIYQYHRNVDGTSHFPYASRALWDIFGVKAENAQHDSGLVLAAVHPDDRARVVETLKASGEALTPWKQEYRVVLPERSSTLLAGERWLLGQASPQRLPDGSTLWHGYTHDITDERHAQERLRLGASVLAHSYDGILVTDTRNVIIEVNPAFTRITGYQSDEVLGRTPQLLSSGQHGPEFYATMWARIQEQGHWNGEIWNRRKNGEIYAETLSIAAVADETGQTTHYIAVFSDITRLKTHEAQLTQIAHYDVLTGLPNRRLLGDRMQVALARARRDQRPLAVCMLDLDGFKEINDTHGHAAGDDLLVEVARRLQKSVREDDTVARLGGDEFVLLLSDLQHPEESHSTLERLLQSIAQPITLGAASVKVSASVGMTRYPHDPADADTLLRHADQAMYAAKQAGKNRYHLFDPEHDRQIQTHREKLDRLKQAMVAGELVMYYQPKVNLRSGDVIGMEALIRWQHPTLGLLPPASFLPLLAGNVFEHQLGDWVIEQVLLQITEWQALGLDWVVSANLSAGQLLNGHFAADLALALAAHPQVKPQHLELEILETASIDDMEIASQVLHRCRALGVRFALDDFGTGYSSLSYFRSLPVDMIKIDQSFVRDMLEDPDDLSIVDSVVRLAQAFNRPVIAEGVETLAHGSALLQLGCTLAQGYGVARPMPAEQVSGWIARWQADAVWKTLDQPDSGRDLALSVVTRSHRNWVDSVLHRLDEGPECLGAAPPIHTCALGRWLTGSGATTYGDSLYYKPVCQLHDHVHELANGLLAHPSPLLTPETVRLRLALETASTQLLSHLEHLIQAPD